MIAGKYGKEYTNNIKSKIMGKHTDELVKTLVEELELPLTAEQLSAECKSVFATVFPKSKVMEGE